MTSETIHDPLIGELIRDEEDQRFIGDVHLTPKHIVRVFLSCEGERVREIPVVCRILYAGIRRKEWEHRLATAAALVDLYNDSWVQDDEQEETPESFARQLELETIFLHYDGSATLFYEDDDRFFGGHYIAADLDEQGNFIVAEVG